MHSKIHSKVHSKIKFFKIVELPASAMSTKTATLPFQTLRGCQFMNNSVRPVLLRKM